MYGLLIASDIMMNSPEWRWGWYICSTWKSCMPTTFQQQWIARPWVQSLSCREIEISPAAIVEVWVWLSEGQGENRWTFDMPGRWRNMTSGRKNGCMPVYVCVPVLFFLFVWVACFFFKHITASCTCMFLLRHPKEALTTPLVPFLFSFLFLTFVLEFWLCRAKTKEFQSTIYPFSLCFSVYNLPVSNTGSSCFGFSLPWPVTSFEPWPTASHVTKHADSKAVTINTNQVQLGDYHWSWSFFGQRAPSRFQFQSDFCQLHPTTPVSCDIFQKMSESAPADQRQLG